MNDIADVFNTAKPLGLSLFSLLLALHHSKSVLMRVCVPRLLLIWHTL